MAGAVVIATVGLAVSWTAALLTAIGLGITAWIIALRLSRWMHRRVVAPLKTLEETVAVWRLERLDARAPTGNGGEIDHLIGKLNFLAGHFEKVFAKLTVRTRTDLVTGLPSRSQLLLDISLTTQPALFLVNVDSFKEINDSYGNRTGDEVLQALADRLGGFQTTLPFRLCKMPADEFALLFDVPLEESDIVTVAKSLIRRIHENDFTIVGQPLRLRVTCGVARGDRTYLVAQADMALKNAKKHSRPFEVYEESRDIQRQFENSLFWKNAVAQALQDNRVVAHFQPIVDNLTGKIAKYETLVRLRGTENALYYPSDFLDAARRSHLDAQITRAMVTQSFEAFSRRPYDFSVNLAVSDMLNPDIHRFLLETIEAYPDTAQRLVVEILESEGIGNYKEVKAFLTDLKAAGVRVAIDDFGSGYSNFDHLLKLEVDYIKLDASLIQHLDTDRNAQVIVKTIVGFSKELGLRTISEHVHNEGVYQASCRLGVDFSQGFHLGKPGPLGEPT